MALTSLFALGSPDITAALPSADDVIAMVAQHDMQRQSALQGYTGARLMVLENFKHHKRAEMRVSVICHKDGSKEFEIVSSSGWGGAKKYVFPKLLEAEVEASRPGSPEDSRLTPDNYSFKMLRAEDVDGRKTYAIEVTPKKDKKYLMRGTVWIDANEFAIVRVEGQPAKNPSFWVKKTEFARRYEKQGSFWFPVSNISASEVRFFGRTDLTINYMDYVVNGPVTLASGNPQGTRPR